ncbi:sugar phosphate isomerase/epimerase [Clostridium sp. SY8519]|uniref:sugar phosphate isomerase/epimerase family protein n=1 Tax=Clostridium sp. (strain SY8519) TaxID=1042156 RepID=UPI0002171AED|nr:sugar phosphate isomerase/epimerase [Clostridium sp. SY8519]BAK47556.1 sugar phosphate isomerase/epimerase [Clostridium sp. SY8519]
MKFGLSSLAWQSPFSNPMEIFAKAKKYGCDLYEICVEDFDSIDVNEISEAKAKFQIETPTICGAFGDTRDISSDNPEYRQGGIEYIKGMVDLAVKIDCKVIVGPMYSACGKARQISEEEKKQQWDWAVENMKIVAAYAKERGIRFAVEPLNRFETDFINTVDQALELIRRVGADNVGILLDTFHMNIEESNIVEAIRKAGDKIYHFHTCANNRGIPGEDNFDWDAISKAIKEVGYDDYCVIESFTPDCKEIAKSASVWRTFAESPEAIPEKGIPFLRKTFA